MDSFNKKDPNIFEYDNYRDFLSDYYVHKKAQKKSFSHRNFSKAAGYQSSCVLRLVINGSRNLNNRSLDAFTKALKLDAKESTFFRNLVQFNQAKTIEEKQRFAKDMLRSKAYGELKPLAKARFQYWSNWYYVVIRELIDLDTFQEDPNWIANQLIPKISTDHAKEALQHLLELGLVKRNDEGRLVQAEGSISTGDDVITNSLFQFHRQMILKGSESLDQFKGATRQISCLTLGLSEENQLKAKEMIHQFRKELMGLAKEKQDGNRVMQVNFQFFPLTESVSRK